MKNYPFIAHYRRFWHNLHALVDITTKDGARTITEAIQRLEKMAADVGLSALPAMAVLPNVLTLWFVLQPLMGTWATLPLVATIETLPFVLAFHVFRTDDKETLKHLLVAYYGIVFALTIAFKVFAVDGVSLQSVAWLLLPCISVVAMLSYGKISSMGEQPQTPVLDTMPTPAHPGTPTRAPTDEQEPSEVDKRRLLVANFFQQGMSIAAIAQEVGVSRRTVNRDLESMGLKS